LEGSCAQRRNFLASRTGYLDKQVWRYYLHHSLAAVCFDPKLVNQIQQKSSKVEVLAEVSSTL
jgi:hypothetical protein